VNKRYTLVIFLVFVALVVLAVTLRDTEPKQVGSGAPTPTPQPLLEVDADDIEEVAVESEAGEYVLSRVAGGWEVDGEEATDEVDGLVSRLASPSVQRELPADRDPEVYGFATPTLTVTLRTAAGDAYVMQVGDEVPAGYDVYVRLVPGEGAGAQIEETRIVIMGGGDFERLKDWIEDPPIEPTPTPEATETVEAAIEEEGTPGAATEEATAEAGEEVTAEPTDGALEEPTDQPEE
jgi:hypothetical protein